MINDVELFVPLTDGLTDDRIDPFLVLMPCPDAKELGFWVLIGVRCFCGLRLWDVCWPLVAGVLVELGY